MKKFNYMSEIIKGLILVFISALILFGIYLYKKGNIVDTTKIQYPNSYRELYDLINSKKTFGEQNVVDTLSPSFSEEKGSSDYSKTNVQVAGVDEADIVKTDGEYIYSIANDYLYIVKVKDGNMEIVSKIKSRETTDTSSSNYIEMYIKDNRLIILKNKYEYMYSQSKSIMPDYFWGGNGEVSILIYDVTNKTNPIKLNELSQSGSYLTSRMVDNYIYVTTNYYVYNDIKPTDEKTYVPMLKADVSRTIAIDDILIAPNPQSNSYLTVTGTDINNASDFISSKAILGSSSNIYADSDSLYIAGYGSETVDNTYISKTSLIKLSMLKGVIKLDATGTINGNILNQFSMDEYEGNFRIATTSNDYTYKVNISYGRPFLEFGESITKNNLYVLDSNLNVVSKIEGLAKGERIYSVRFDSDVAYFVTFKQVDPLFVVDLSNPNKPVIKSELKIPGFSEYLHVFNNKYLFGLGKEADLEGRVTGLKISMFNIEDKSNVTEEYKLKVGDNNSWSESSYNHKAILVSSDKNIIGFPVNDYYVAYKFIDGVGFEEIGKINFNQSNNYYYYYYGSVRGLYIDNYLYAVSQNMIKSLNLTSLKPGTELELYKIEEEPNIEKPTF